MVLPFTPLALTFKDMHYYVALPKVNHTCTCPAVWNIAFLACPPASQLTVNQHWCGTNERGITSCTHVLRMQPCWGHRTLLYMISLCCHNWQSQLQPGVLTEIAFCKANASLLAVIARVIFPILHLSVPQESRYKLCRLQRTATRIVRTCLPQAYEGSSWWCKMCDEHFSSQNRSISRSLAKVCMSTEMDVQSQGMLGSISA